MIHIYDPARSTAIERYCIWRIDRGVIRRTGQVIESIRTWNRIISMEFRKRPTRRDPYTVEIRRGEF